MIPKTSKNHHKFVRCFIDQAIFFKHTSNSGLAIVVVYINDCMIAATSIAMITKFKLGMKRYIGSCIDCWVLSVEKYACILH